MRVVTWNLWWRFGSWERRLPAILAVLRELAPDVVTLQEVWEHGGENLAGLLADELGLHWAFGASEAPERFQRRIGDPTVGVGNAVLSRWSIVGEKVARLPGTDGRLVLHARLDAPGHQVPVFTTHLSAEPYASGLRQDQVREVAAFVAAHRGGTEFPPVVTGDLNAWPDSDEVRLLGGYRTAPPVPGQFLLDAWEYAAPGEPAATWDPVNPYVSAASPAVRIDYVFVGEGPVGHVRAVRRAGDRPVDGVWASDHFAVVVDLTD